ncbi:hypothetical protein V9T40_014161 [Parthenolecanium corni]|uniref:Secreted protein n=1 Tax=Parthenolecanium corni TaxID=536013 RepID=A0AAN9Y3C3_9HEMI
MSHFSSRCLNFHLVASIFGWMSHFSSSCFNFHLVASIFGWMSHVSSRCVSFSPDRITSKATEGSHFEGDDCRPGIASADNYTSTKWEFLFLRSLKFR